MLKPKVSVIIVNFDGEKFLNKCLKSIFNQSYKNYDVILVDNGSTDNSIRIASSFKNLKIIKLKYNSGFCKANNIGIRFALKDIRTEYICTLNNDTIPDYFFLSEIVVSAIQDNKIGSVQAKIIFPNGKIQSAGLLYFEDLTGPDQKGLSRGFNEEEIRYNKPKEIFAPTAAAALYSSAMLKQIGFFDENYFAYAEDLDLGLRARIFGWKSYYSPNAKVMHFHSQTGKVASIFKAYHIKRNTNFTAIKNLPFLQLSKYFFSLSLNSIKLLSKTKKDKTSIGKLTKKIGHIGIIKISGKIIIDTIKHCPKLIKQRRYIQKYKVISNKEINLLRNFK